MTVEVQIGDAGDVEVLGEELGDLTEVLDGIGAVLTSRAQAAFRDQKRGPFPWAPRLVPNVPGVIRDLNAGGFPKARRFQPRPALIDTGTLRRSITWAVGSGGRSVTVGTNVPYADLHNEGGMSTSTLTGRGRQQLTLWLRRDRSRRRFGLGFLFSQATVEVQVQKRPFLTLEPADRAFVVEELERALGRKVRARVG